MDLLPDHRAHGTWFGDLAQAPDREGRSAVFARWWQDPTLAGLRDLREDCISLTPVEMVTALVDALDLPERIRAWSTPDQRLRTLDALRKVAAQYADRARADSSPITLTGLRIELDARWSRALTSPAPRTPSGWGPSTAPRAWSGRRWW